MKIFKNEIITEVYLFRNVLEQLVMQQLTLRYRRTFLGFFWTLLSPLLTMIITTFIFSSFMGMDIQSFAVYFFSGLMAWNCFNNTVTQSCSSFVSNESLIRKIYLPKILFPLSNSIAVFIDSVLCFIALYLLVYAISNEISFVILFIPLAYIILFIFSFGIALVFSVVNVFFRDLQYVIGIVMQAWFFLTPVMYKINGVSPKTAEIINLNPVVHFINLFREPLYFNRMPNFDIIATCIIYSFISLIIGITIYHKFKNKIIYRL